MYKNGEGVEKNLKKALEYYQKAADQNHPAAQNNLGVMYENGYAVKKDLKKAKEYYRVACDNGDIWGCYVYVELNEQGIQ